MRSCREGTMVRRQDVSLRAALLWPCLLLLGCATAQGGFATDEDLAGSEDLSLSPEVDLRRAGDLASGADLRPITDCQVAPQSGCPVGMKCTTHDSANSI